MFWNLSGEHMISASVDPKEYFSGAELVNHSVCYYQYEIFIVQDITCKNMFTRLFSLLLSYHEEGKLLCNQKLCEASAIY